MMNPVVGVRYCDGFKKVNRVTLQLMKPPCTRMGDNYKETKGHVVSE